MTRHQDNEKTTKPTKATKTTKATKATKAEVAYEVQLPMKVVPFTGRKVPALPPNYKSKLLTRDEIETRMHLAFEVIGGVERFAIWADQNPTEFYRMYAKLLPDPQLIKPQLTELNINLGGTAIPASPLDDIELRDEAEVNKRYIDGDTE